LAIAADETLGDSSSSDTQEIKLMAEAGKTFGTCCEELKEALEGGDFEP
jgi:hypothetical protein